MKVVVEKGGYSPIRGSEGAAGYDLTSPVDVVIPPHSSAKIDLQIRVAIPSGFVGILTHRSGQNFKSSLIVPVGTIDGDYRGVVKVKVYNLSERNQTISAGERFSQIVLIPVYSQEVEIVSELDKTSRGDKGFGSTGQMSTIPEGKGDGKGSTDSSGQGGAGEGVDSDGSGGKDVPASLGGSEPAALGDSAQGGGSSGDSSGDGSTKRASVSSKESDTPRKSLSSRSKKKT